MIQWLLRLLLTPIFLLLAAGVMAVAIYFLDETTPLVQWSTQKLPALSGPTVVVKKTGAVLLENGQRLAQDVQQTILPDPKTSARQSAAKKQLKTVNAVLEDKRAHLNALRQEVTRLEKQQQALDVQAYPLKKWIIHQDPSQNGTGSSE